MGEWYEWGRWSDDLHQRLVSVARPAVARLRRWMVVGACLLVAGGIAVAKLAVHHHWNLWAVDLAAYRAAGGAVRHGMSIYVPPVGVLPFIYPFFAALVFGVLSLPSLSVAMVAWSAVEAACLIATIWLCLRRDRQGPTPRRHAGAHRAPTATHPGRRLHVDRPGQHRADAPRSVGPFSFRRTRPGHCDRTGRRTETNPTDLRGVSRVHRVNSAGPVRRLGAAVLVYRRGAPVGRGMPVCTDRAAGLTDILGKPLGLDRADADRGRYGGLAVALSSRGCCGRRVLLRRVRHKTVLVGSSPTVDQAATHEYGRAVVRGQFRNRRSHHRSVAGGGLVPISSGVS